MAMRPQCCSASALKEQRPMGVSDKHTPERLGLEARQCPAAEDFPTGLRAAKTAGLRVAGYTGGSVLQDTSRADWTAASFAEIACLLEALAPNQRASRLPPAKENPLPFHLQL